jgi:hypothetical protein
MLNGCGFVTPSKDLTVNFVYQRKSDIQARRRMARLVACSRLAGKIER